MSLYNPIYASATFQGYKLEGEYIPQWTDYFAPNGYDTNWLTKEKHGYFRSFDRLERQSIIDRNMRKRKMGYASWMNLGEAVDCDAFVTHEDMDDPFGTLLVNDFRIIKEDDLTTDRYEIELCKIDILDRMIILLRNIDRDGNAQPEDIHRLNELELVRQTITIENNTPLRYRRITFTDKFSSFFKSFIK